jgi:hypothetical protein
MYSAKLQILKEVNLCCRIDLSFLISVIKDEYFIKTIPKHFGLREAKARLPAKTNANILYIVFAKFGREIYKRRQKLMVAELKMILLFLEIPYIV